MTKKQTAEQKLKIIAARCMGISARSISKVFGVTRYSIEKTVEEGVPLDFEEKFEKVEPYRCEKCGFKVIYRPCYACYIRAQSGKK